LLGAFAACGNGFADRAELLRVSGTDETPSRIESNFGFSVPTAPGAIDKEAQSATANRSLETAQAVTANEGRKLRSAPQTCEDPSKT